MGVVIDLAQLEARHVIEAARRALEVLNDPPVTYKRGGRLVRLYTDETGTRAAEHGRRSLQLRLAEVADWGRTSARGAWLPSLPSQDVAGMIEAAGDWDVPVLERVVTAPVFGRSGRLLQAGYNAEDRTYLALDPRLTGHATGGYPLGQALALLDELLEDFPLADDAARAGALALMLTPLVRDMVHGPTPLFLVDAPMEGVGKTLLARACLAPVCGEVALTPGIRSDEELTKTLVATLRTAPSAVVLDNVKGALDSPGLAQALTVDTWNPRVLGRSEVVNLRVRNVWVITSNNARLSAELRRRTVRVLLMPTAGDRHFHHGDLLGWVSENRSRLFGALVSLVEEWQLAGSYRYTGPVLPSYEEWARLVGGILEVAGVPGLLSNTRETREAVDAEEDELAGLLEAWQRALGAAALPSHEVLARALAEPGLAAALPTTRNAFSLGKYLQQWKDRPTDGRVLRREGRTWRVESTSADSYTLPRTSRKTTA